MIHLSPKWWPELQKSRETGMGYLVVDVMLRDGVTYRQVVIQDGTITGVRGFDQIPFREEEIARIVVTHDKWDFNAERKNLGES